MTQSTQFPMMKPKLVGPAGAGYSVTLDPIDPFEFEELWQPVENHIGEAIDAVEAGSVLTSETHLDVLRHCLALHFARSHVIDRIARQLVGSVMDRQEARMKSDPALVSPSGILPSGPEGRAAVAKAVRDRIEAQGFRPERLVPERMMDNFTVALGKVAGAPVEIGVAEADEFLIGDSPAQTLNSQGRAGVLGGVPWDQAGTVVMPLGRFHVMGLGKTNKYVTLKSRHVDYINRVQVDTAAERVMWHPDADFRKLVREMRP